MTRKLPRWLLVVALGLGGALTIDLARQALAADRVAWRNVDAPVDAFLATDTEPEAIKPLLLRFTADWCGPCRTMEANVFSRANVADAIHARFEPLLIDLTAPGEAERTWAERYGVNVIPTMLIVDAEGREHARLTGGIDAEAFMAWLDRGESPKPAPQ